MQSRVKGTMQVVAQAALLGLYAYAAATKWLHLHQFHADLRQSPLFDATLAHWLTYTIPLWETVLCGLLLMPRTQWLGYWASLLTLLSFTTYSVFLDVQFSGVGCGCGGVIGKLSGAGHIGVNLFFAALSVVGVMGCDEKAERGRRDKAQRSGG